MSLPRIALVMSTTRATRFCDKPTAWIEELARERGDMDVERLDLRDWPMPFFDEPASNAWMPSKNEIAQRWQKKVAEFDGYIFIMAEYNRAVPGVLKNAIDYAYPEWNRKPAAFVGYGSVGAARSIEIMRNICVELQMAPMRNGVHIQGGDFMAVWQQGKDIRELTYLAPNVKAMFEELMWWTRALRNAREEPLRRAA
jgi:NAD(P)H-dependent FMN reductase